VSEAVLTARQRRVSLGAVIAATFGVGAFLGISMPLPSLIMERWGVPAWLIGLNGAMPSFAVLVLGPFLARIVQWVGARTAMLGGFLIASVSMLLMPVLPHVGIWFVLRFLMGFGMAMPWLVGETWINVIARDHNRARMVGLYTAVLFLGMAVGPLVLQTTDVTGFAPFVLGVGALMLAALPLIAAWRLIPPIDHAPSLRLAQVIRQAPTVAGAALIAGLSESTFYFLLPVYGLRAGLEQGSALTLLSVLIVGGIVLQYPIGWIADRMDRRRLLIAMAVVATLATPLVALAVAAPWASWPVLFLLGGLSLGYYGVGLALLGARFGPGDLAVANAAFIVLYEGGSFVGPTLAGTAMDLWNPHGYLVFLAVTSIAYALLALYRTARAP
jgi:MFS family permease